MKIYNVIIEDRHSDVEVESYGNKIQAIARAKYLANKYCTHREDYKEHDYVKEWLFFVEYSCESDSVRVVETELKGG